MLCHICLHCLCPKRNTNQVLSKITIFVLLLKTNMSLWFVSMFDIIITMCVTWTVICLTCILYFAMCCMFVTFWQRSSSLAKMQDFQTVPISFICSFIIMFFIVSIMSYVTCLADQVFRPFMRYLVKIQVDKEEKLVWPISNNNYSTTPNFCGSHWSKSITWSDSVSPQQVPISAYSAPFWQFSLKI